MKKQKITPCLWFDNQAEEAVGFYTSLFVNSKPGKVARYGKEGQEQHTKEPGDVMTVQFFLDGQEFTALNGGPHFQINPAITFFVVCETAKEVDEMWEKLVEGGEAMMPLDKYEWSDRYGWLSDRYGVSWQLYLGNPDDVGQKISPLLFFTGANRGRAEAAHDFYLDVFRNTGSDGVLKYKAGEEGPEGMVKHAQFKLEGQTFMVMDSGVENDFSFNEAVSLVVSCSTQEEVDEVWNKLSSGGSEQPCGWLKDRFGVSWQVVPELLPELLAGDDRKKAGNAMKALMRMKKIEIEDIREAYEKG